jgi:phage/plasmid-associated DNA primase
MGTELMDQIALTEQAKQQQAQHEARYGISLKNGLSNYSQKN